MRSKEKIEGDKDQPKEKKKKKEERRRDKKSNKEKGVENIEPEEELFDEEMIDISDDDQIFSMASEMLEVPKSKFFPSQSKNRKANITGPCPVPGTIYTDLIHKSFNAGRGSTKITDNATVTFHCRQFHYDKVYNG
jgi:hypothetical protein